MNHAREWDATAMLYLLTLPSSASRQNGGRADER